MAIHAEASERARAGARDRGLELTRQLGWGKDGVVFETSARTALKALVERRAYFNEVSVYLRLLEREITDVEGFTIPRLVSFDDERMLVEMSQVSPPCVLDFANAGLDGPLHEFPPSVLAAQERENEDVFEAR